MGKVKVNEKWEFSLNLKEGVWEVDGKKFDLDILPLKKGAFHVLDGIKSYRVQMLDLDTDTKEMKFQINGQEFTVAIEDDHTQLLKQMGIQLRSTNHDNEIKAPMPGMVLDVLVADGQQIKKGDPVLVLEAMKMENILKSPGDGVVKSVTASKGDTVKKNQTLMMLN